MNATTCTVGGESKRTLSFIFILLTVLLGAVLLNFPKSTHADSSNIVLSVPFSEGAGSTTLDKSIYGLTGTVLNGTLWNAGKYDTAIQTDGTNDHVEFPNATHLNIAGNTISLSAWVYPTATSSTRIIFGKPSSATQNTSPNFSYALLTVNGKPRFHLRLGSTTYTLNSSANLTLNAWQHVSATYDGATMKIYLNGIQRGTRTATGNVTTFQTPLRIGVNGARTQAWAGRIDDVRVYSRALSQNEITADMALGAGEMIVDTLPPTIAINTPIPNAIVGGTATVSATATDNMSVAGVTFFLDGTALGSEDLSAPYTLSWNTRAHTNGLHTLEARARDSADNTSSATVTVTIFNDTTPPSSPQNLTGEALSSQSISLSWSSSTDDVGVVGYRIYKNSVLSGTTLTTTSTQSNLIASTTYEFGVVAYDSAGNVSSTSTVSVTTLPNTIGTSSGMFPLSISGNGRYLVDAHGSPFFMHGDTAWSLMAQLTVPEAQQYLDDRKQKGFNTIMVSLVEHAYADNPPLNTFGVAPFLVPNDMSTVNEAYFTFTDQILAEAAARDMLVLLFPAYVGCCGGDGWQSELGQTSLPGLRNYGRYLGTKFGAYENIIWMMGGDRGPGTALDGIREIVQGIEETAGPQLFSVHNGRYQSGVTQYPVGESWIDINTTYSDCSANNYLQDDAERTPSMPFFFIEGFYEDEGGIGAVSLDCLRGQAYRPFLMGGFGHLFGNNPIWNFNGSPITPTPKTWQEALNSEGSQTMVHVGNLMRSRAWHLLVPDFSHAVLTSGYGTITDHSYAPAARTSDGKSVIVYTPSQRNLTIAMTAIQGAQVNAWWYNVTTGSSTLEGTYPATGSRTFTPPWNGDSVLVLDDAAMGYGAPGITIPPVPDTQSPTEPTGLSGIGATESSINLTWTASLDNIAVAGYTITRNGLTVGTTTAAGYTDIGLAGNTTYTYTVTAFDNARNYSSPSTPTQVTTLSSPETEPPTIPSSVLATALSWSQAQVSWSSSTDNVGVVGYRVYRNGVQIATTTQTSVTDAPLSASTTYGYTVRAYDAAGNQSGESGVASVTTPGLPPPSSGLLAAYSFDEGSGTLLLDRTTNGRNGTISGSPAWTTGKNGLTVDFDGTNDAISLGSILPIQGIPALTLSAWVKRNAPNELVEIGKQGGSGGDTLAIELWNDGLAYFGISSPSGYAAGYVPLNDTAWHHVALIYDGTQTGNAGKLKGYIDGVQQTLTFTGTIPSLTTTNTNEFNVGKIGGSYTGGLIDDLRVYNRVQSGAEVQTDMNTPVQ